MITKLLVVVGAVGAGLVCAVMLALLQGGVATVSVQTPEIAFFAPVPVVLADIALAFVPPNEIDQARRELEPYRELIQLALEELSGCPDATFVEVESPDETVLVEKKGSDLRVEVHSFRDSTHVTVRVPLHSVKRVVAAVAG